jgi:hypothetical protein
MLLLGGKAMTALLSAQVLGDLPEDSTTVTLVPLRLARMTGLVGASLTSFAPRYAALMRDLCRARSSAAKRCDWVRFRELGDEVAMIGAVIAHQAQLRELVAA